MCCKCSKHWVDNYHGLLLLQSLGQVGRVMKVFPTGDVRVTVNSRTWTFNPQCLSYAPGEELSEAPSTCTYVNILSDGPQQILSKSQRVEQRMYVLRYKMVAHFFLLSVMKQAEGRLHKSYHGGGCNNNCSCLYLYTYAKFTAVEYCLL